MSIVGRVGAMSEDEVTGPSMFSATTVMKTPPTRVGRISKDITLPRTVELKKLIAAVVGGIIGLGVGFAVAGANLRGILFGVVIFGALGIGIVTYSPLKGESLSTWVGLTFKARRNRVTAAPGITGKVYVGVAPVPTTASNERVKVVTGAVEVSVGSFDERGVLINRKSALGSKVLKNFGPPARGAVRGKDRASSVTWGARRVLSAPSFDLLPRASKK